MPVALVIQHEAIEHLAGFREPVLERCYSIESIHVLDPNYAKLDLLEPDLLFIMGGTMAVYENEANPWMRKEVVRVAERIVANRPTVGICLGAQVMAAAMGGRVHGGAQKEVGFAPITLNAAGKQSPLAAIDGIPILHWHGDTFELPDDVTLLASTERYAHQAFARGPNILALQFHPEMGEDQSFGAWCDGSEAFIESAGTDIGTLQADYTKLGPTAAAAGRDFLRDWLAKLES